MTVHPRRCGELQHNTLKLPKMLGSSPQVRGTHKNTVGDKIELRFIPAGAGNSCPICAEYDFSPVHPRRCGELLIALAAQVRNTGSSPQVRGTRLG